MIYAGSCHCGALGFAFTTAIEPSAWRTRACQCAFCRAHGSLTASDPAGALAWTHRDAAALVRYRFGLRTADFLLCARCGVYLGASAPAPGGEVGLVNTRALVDALELPAPQPMTYDGETAEARQARRAARWTPVRG